MDVGLVDNRQQQVVPSSSPPSSTNNVMNNRQNAGSFFGKDMSKDVAFNEEQQSQLGKLREEAANAGKESG